MRGGEGEHKKEKDQKKRRKRDPTRVPFVTYASCMHKQWHRQREKAIKTGLTCSETCY